MSATGNKGEVTYTLRADDSQLDKDLDAAEKKVKKSAQDSADSCETIEKNTAKVKKEVKEEVTDHHRQQDSEQEKSSEESGKRQEESARKRGENLKTIASGTAKAIGAGMLAVGAAAIGIGTASINSANDMKKAMNQFIASTNVGTDKTEKYKKVMESIYKNNYGDSFEDIGEAMAQVTKQLGEMSDGSLQEVTESAFALRDTFGYDITESTRAAKAMMDNFGISGEEAMNLIAAGAQNGLDYSGELIDSISEYSVQFAKAGLDADDMFKIFQKGAESGAFNLDKVGDAVKEFSIRAIDGSDSTVAGFQAIGLNADEMAQKMAVGGDSAKQAFQETIDALAAMKDPIEQNTAGVALFGTMWEDLGPEAVAALADIEDGAYDTADAMGQLKEVKYDDVGSMFEALKRSVEVLIIPLGEQLIPLLQLLIADVLPIIEEYLPPLIELVAGMATQLLPIIEELLPVFLELFSEIAPLLGQLVDAVLPILVELFQTLVPPIMTIISEVLPPLIELVSALLPIFQSLMGLLTPIIDLFLNLLDPVVNLISKALTPLMETLQPIVAFITESIIPVLEVLTSAFDEAFSGIAQTVENQISNITGILEDVIDFVKNVFSGDWGSAWKNVKSIFGTSVSGIGELLKTPLNFCIDLVNGFINGLNKIKIPDWVPSVGGKGINIPPIPRLKVGLDYVPTDFYPAYLDEGEAVLTKQENALLRELGGIQGMYTLQYLTKGNTADVDYQRIGNEFAKALSSMKSDEDKYIILNWDGQEMIRWMKSENDAQKDRTGGPGLFD